MGKLILKEFKETAKYFLPVWSFCIVVYLLARFSILSGVVYDRFYDTIFTLFVSFFVFCAVTIPLAISVVHFDGSVFPEDEDSSLFLQNPSKTIISKAIPAAFWYIFVLFSIYNIYSPTIPDKMINNPDYFADETYYLFNPFPGGFDIELIDFYIVRTVVDTISIFLSLIIVFLIFYICVCISHTYCYGSKILTFVFIFASLHVIIYGYGGICVLLLFIGNYFSIISELYSGVFSTCIGIIIEIIIGLVLFFACKKLLEKALAKQRENLIR